MVVDEDFVVWRECYGVFQLFGVGKQVDLYENIFQFDLMCIVVDMILIYQIIYFLFIVQDFLGQGVGDDGDVVQVVQFLLQDFIGVQFVIKFQKGYM